MRRKKKGNLNEALSFYAKAEALGESTPQLLNDIGILYEQVGFSKKAEHHYLKAIEQDQYYLPAYMNLAYFYKKIGKMDQAAVYFQKRYELAEEEDSWTEKAKEELLQIKPEYQQRVTSMEAKRLSREMVRKTQEDLAKRVDESNKIYQKGVEFFRAGQYKNAIIEFNQALKVTPKNPKVIKARNKTISTFVRKRVQKRKQRAIEMINTGSYASAMDEVKKILTIMEKKPNLISE